MSIVKRWFVLLAVLIISIVVLASGCKEVAKVEKEAKKIEKEEKKLEKELDNKEERKTNEPGSSTVSGGAPGKFTTGVFDGCPPAGDGGDGELSSLKNRDLPPPSYSSMIVSQIINNHPTKAEAEGKKDRTKWNSASLEEVHTWEKKGVVIEGFLLGIKQEGPESCNCHSNSDRDYHMWLSANPGDDKTQAMVVELSPRLLGKHPNWNKKVLGKLSSQGAKMRISGWLTWDQEHGSEVGKSRGTNWEVHPIHRIEVFSGGNWRSIDQ